MILHSSGESIEGEKCVIIARKIVPSIPFIDDELGRVIKYECSRNSSAEIKEEINPKEPRYKATSKLDLGTKLKADSLYLITTQLKRLKTSLINKSGRHKASSATTNSYTFAEIKYPLENVLKSIENRKKIGQ